MILKSFYILKSRTVTIAYLTILGFIALAILVSSGVKGALAMSGAVPVTCFETEKKEVSITVNVYEFTDAEGILDKLDGRKATFFISEEYQETHPDKVKLIADTGHDIGLLLSSMSGMTKSEVNNLLAHRVERMARITGKNTYIVRFNHNRYDDDSLQTIYDVGLLPVQWSADDTDDNFTKGDIILMTGEVNTEKFLLKTEADGFSFITVSEAT